MKTSTRLLLTSILFFGMFPGVSIAGDAALSPKAKQWQHQNRRLGGAEVDHLDRTTWKGSPKLRQQRYQARRVRGTTIDKMPRGAFRGNVRALSNRRALQQRWRNANGRAGRD